MNKVYTLVTGPASEPIEVADAISFLRAADDDAEYVAGIISVAREMVENFTGRALLAQTWKMAADVWPTGDGMRWPTITLDRTPLASVVSVKYWPSGGSAQTTLSTDMYTVQTGAEPGRLFLNYDEDWPDIEERPDAVEVNFMAGYASAAAIPATLKHAMRLIVSHLYDQRAPLNIGNVVNELPYSLKHLLESQRVGGWVC